jgi:hypothetical protein
VKGTTAVNIGVLPDAFYERIFVKTDNVNGMVKFLAKGDDEYHRQFWLWGVA